MRKGRNLELIIQKINDCLIPGATIKSPEIVNDVDTGTPREVDVGVRFSTDQGSVFIAIECRDRGAVQDIQWIEQLISKKRSIEADVLIAVTSSSFTEPAKIKAFKNGIEIRSLSAFSGDDLSIWVDETYLELHTLDAQILPDVEMKLERGIQPPVIIDKNTYYYNGTSKETLNSDAFLKEVSKIIYENSFPEHILNKIPKYGDEVRFEMTMPLNHYYLIIPSNLYLLTPERKVRIEKIKLNLIVSKYIDRYPLTSISKYKDARTKDSIAELFEYGNNESRPCQLISDDKKRETSWYLDPSQLDLGGRIFSNITLKCREPAQLSQVKIKQ